MDATPVGLVSVGLGFGQDGRSTGVLRKCMGWLGSGSGQDGMHTTT